MEEKQLGMTWLKIYTVIFAIRTVFVTFSAIVRIAYCIKNGLPTDSIEAARTIAYSIDCAFIIIVFAHFIKKTSLGYYLNIAYIFMGQLAVGVVSTINTSTQDTDISLETYIIVAIVLEGIFMLAWGLPNYIYFKHRKFLFSGKLSDKKIAANTGKEIQKIAPATHQAKDEPACADIAAQTSIPSEELRILKDLHESGVLTDEEFAQKKKKLLGIQ